MGCVIARSAGYDLSRATHAVASREVPLKLKLVVLGLGRPDVLIRRSLPRYRRMLELRTDVARRIEGSRVDDGETT